MSQAQPSAAAANPRRFRWRRLFQYKLRTLLILTTLIAVWIAWWSHAARQQRIAVAAFEKSGAFVGYGYDTRTQKLVKPRYWPTWLVNAMGTDYFLHVDAVFGHNSQVTDADLRHLKRFTALRSLSLATTLITDAGLEHLNQLKTLKRLDLSGNIINGVGLQHLEGLTSLHDLILCNNPITDDGINHLQEFPSLIHLQLDRTKVTDAGLLYLRRFNSLQELTLNNTVVTDAGLEHLRGLTSLRYLDVKGTKTSNAGVARLQQALPNCLIEH